MMDEGPPPWLHDACAFVESDAANIPSIGDTASAVGVTPDSLLAAFGHFLGFAPNELLADVLASRPDPLLQQVADWSPPPPAGSGELPG
jgi:hypothetical protein